MSLLLSLSFSLSLSYKFIKEASKSSVSLYKSLRPTLENVNTKLSLFIQSLPTKSKGIPSPLPTIPIPLFQNLNEGLEPTTTDIGSTSSSTLPDTSIPSTPPTIRVDLLPSVIHDTRKLLLTLHHNAEKHLMMSDVRYLRTFLGTWFSILVEIASAVKEMNLEKEGIQGIQGIESGVGSGLNQESNSSRSQTLMTEEDIIRTGEKSFEILNSCSKTLKALERLLPFVSRWLNHKTLWAHLSNSLERSKELTFSKLKSMETHGSFSGEKRNLTSERESLKEEKKEDREEGLMDWVQSMVILSGSLKQVFLEWNQNASGLDSPPFSQDEIGAFIKFLVQSIRSIMSLH